MTKPERLVCKWNIFFGIDFVVTLIHSVTYQDVSHFSKSECIWIFRMNCNKSLTHVLVKPLPVQKSICLLIRPFNHPENIGNTSLHPSLSYTIVLIISIKSITLNILTKVYVSVFHHFTARTEDLSYDVTKNDVTLYDVKLWRSFFAWIVWIRQFYKHAKFQHVTLHSLWDLFDNSQLFLTDPRNL